MDSPSARAEVRFYAELNDHLPAVFQYKTLQKSFLVSCSVKDMIESCGVPHSGIELIIANGTSVDFSYLVRDGDRIAVYPMIESLDVTPELRVRPTVLRDLKFVVDVHLGRLTAYLRMLGFDALYQSRLADSELVRISSEQQRVLLTRDRGLLKRSIVSRGYWLRETDSRRQLAEVIGRFDLARQVRPFTRCMACNGLLRDADKGAVTGRVPPPVLEAQHQFRDCASCGRVYRRGPLCSRMHRWIQDLVSG